MLETITRDGIINWTCVCDEGYCRAQLSAHVSDLEYILPPDANGTSGATIATPFCEQCKANGIQSRCFLKADYTLRELASLIHTIVDERGTIMGYAMPLRHVRNLLAHHALYQLDQAKHPPILSIPTEGFLEHPMMDKLKDKPDVAYAFWFAWALMREIGQALPSFDQFFLGMAQPALTAPKEGTNAA